jgi:hypothetical protein
MAVNQRKDGNGMIPEAKLTQFVEEIKTAIPAELESVVLYGSAASQEFHSEFSDINLLCVVRELPVPTLRQLAPIVATWLKDGHPAPLLFTREELGRSTDIFAIELLDIQQHHRVLYGEDVFQTLSVPLTLHRMQLEHELQTKLLLLRQRYLSVAGDSGKVVGLMLESVASFITLFRHALIVMGEKPHATKREIVEQLARRAPFDSSPFLDLLKVREHKLKPAALDGQSVFSKYLQAIEVVVRVVDAI